MPYKLSGVLKSPNGQPLTGVDIQFIAQQTQSPVLQQTDHNIRLGLDGAYNVTLENNTYAVKAQINGLGPQHMGYILISSDTPAGLDLPQLLRSYSQQSTAPDYAQMIEKWLAEAKAAADTSTAQAASAKSQADRAKSEADRASQISGLDTVADAIGLAAVPFPDVWIPFNDSLRMLAGYGRDVKVGDDVVARMVNFERSTTATYIDKSGVLRTAAINEPRFENQGLLIEGQSTNHMAFSEKAWTRTGGAQMSVGINGFFSMPAGDSIQFRDNSATMWPAGLNCTMSIYVIGSGKLSLETSIYGAFSSGVSVEINLDSMTVSDNSKGFVTKISERLYRVGIFVITNATPSPSTGKGLYINQVGVNTDISVNFCQLEALPFASSYIPTNGAAVTRAADKCWITGLGNFTSSFTIATQADVIWDESPSASPRIFDTMLNVSNSPSYRSLGCEKGNVIGQFAVSGGFSLRAERSSKAFVAGTQYRESDASGRVFCNGVLSAFGSGGTTIAPDTITEIRIGGQNDPSGKRSLFGHIRNFRIWHRALSDAQIKGLK